MSTVKSCSKCGTVLPISSFKVRRRRGVPKPHSWCDDCLKAGWRNAPSVRGRAARRIAIAAHRQQQPYAVSPGQAVLFRLGECSVCGTTAYLMRYGRTCGACQQARRAAERAAYKRSDAGLAARAVRRRRMRLRPEHRAWRNLKKRSTGLTRPDMGLWARALADRWAYYGGRCWMCGAEADTWDHVKPMASGGHPTLTCNLRPACRACNCVVKNDAWYGTA